MKNFREINNTLDLSTISFELHKSRLLKEETKRDIKTLASLSSKSHYCSNCSHRANDFCKSLQKIVASNNLCVNFQKRKENN